MPYLNNYLMDLRVLTPFWNPNPLQLNDGLPQVYPCLQQTHLEGYRLGLQPLNPCSVTCRNSPSPLDTQVIETLVGDTF